MKPVRQRVGILELKMLVVTILFVLSKVLTAEVDVRERVIFPVVPNIVQNAENSVCAYEGEVYTSHLDNMTLWAYESKFYKYFAISTNFELLGNCRVLKKASSKLDLHKHYSI